MPSKGTRRALLIAVAAFIVWLTAAGGIEATVTYTVRVLMVFGLLYVGMKVIRRATRTILGRGGTA